MKKFLLAFLLLTMPVQAYENFMIISEAPIKSIQVQNEKIITTKPVTTLVNDKRFLMLTPVNIGKSKLYLTLDKEIKVIDVKVHEKVTLIEPIKGFIYLPIDAPPEPVEIIKPEKE